MKLTTTKQWSSELGNTQIVLTKDDDPFDIPSLVIYDNVDSHSNFYFYSKDLSAMAKIGEEIVRLVEAAKKK